MGVTHRHTHTQQPARAAEDRHSGESRFVAQESPISSRGSPGGDREANKSPQPAILKRTATTATGRPLLANDSY